MPGTRGRPKKKKIIPEPCKRRDKIFKKGETSESEDFSEKDEDAKGNFELIFFNL